jgi:hypothetical protein
MMKRMIITALVIGVIVVAVVMVARSFDVVGALRSLHGR